ncbi:MAG: GNAT family N-acetyltransferase [Rhizobiaceae bacterium]
MTGDVIIREAGIEDLPGCADIINDYIDTTPWLPRLISRSQIAELFNPDMLKSRYLLVADTGRQIGGYLSLNEETEQIGGFYLDPGFRQQGTGKAMMDKAKARSPDQIKLTVFEPNQRARRFYEREGFVEQPDQRQEKTEEGIPTLMMCWRGS